MYMYVQIYIYIYYIILEYYLPLENNGDSGDMTYGPTQKNMCNSRDSFTPN